MTALLGIACIVMFLFLIDYAARLLRPVSILARIGNDGIVVIEACTRSTPPTQPDAAALLAASGSDAAMVYHVERSAILLAVDRATLIRKAQLRTGRDRVRAAGRRLRGGRRTAVRRCTAARSPSTTCRCRRRSPSAPNGRWSRIRCSRFGSSSTSR